jgi:peptide/nickel transport system substrate-binding protein
MQRPQEMAVAIQGYLRQVGIDAKITVFEWGTYLDKVFIEDYTQVPPMHEMSWIMDNGDPDDFLYILFSSEQWPMNGFNESFYKNETVDKLLSQARKEIDLEKRKQLYEEAQKLITADSPWVWIDHAYEIFAMKKDVQGFIFCPTEGRLLFNYITRGD